MLAEKAIPWPQIFDGKKWKTDLAKLFNVRGIPTHFLLDREGKIVSKGVLRKEMPDLVKKTLGP